MNLNSTREITLTKNRKVFHQDDGRQVIHPGGRDILSGDFKEVSRNG